MLPYDISLCILGIDACLNFDINIPIKSVRSKKKEKPIKKLYMYQISKLIKKGPKAINRYKAQRNILHFLPFMIGVGSIRSGTNSSTELFQVCKI